MGYARNAALTIAVSMTFVACGGDEDETTDDLAPVTASCEAMQGQYAVDSGASQAFVLAAPPVINAYTVNTDKWWFSREISDNDTLLLLMGSGAMSAMTGGSVQPADGKSLPVDRALIAPNVTSSTLGTMYAAAPGSGSLVSRDGEQLTFDLRNAVTLEGCGDYPVEGEINLCFRGNVLVQCPAGATGGMVDGIPWTSSPASWAGAGSRMEADLTGDASRFVARTSGGLQGPIVWSYILTSMLGPFEGKVLCSGSGSQIVTITDDAGDQHDVWQLRSLGVLEGSGSSRITGCLR